MPTTHYASRQFLEQKGLDIDWRIDITNPQKKRRKINTNVNDKKFKRASDEIVWVRDGGEHPVYILQVEDSASDDTDDDMVWVQWLSNGKKECIYRNQIIKDGLRGRKRQRANFYAEDKDEGMDVPEHNKKNKSKTIKKSVSPFDKYQAEKQAEDSAVEDRDVNVSDNSKKNMSEKTKSSDHIDSASSEAFEDEEDDVLPTTDHKISDETCPVDGKAAQVGKDSYSRDGYTQKEFNVKMQQLQTLPSHSSNPKQQQYSMMQPQYQQQTQPQFIDRVSLPYAQQVFRNQKKVSSLQILTCDTLQHSSMMLQCGMQLVANAINRHKAEFYNLLKTETNGVTEINKTREKNLAVAMKAANAIMLPEQVVLSQLIKAEQEATDLCIFALQKEKKDGFMNHRSSEYLCLPPRQSSAQRRQGKQSEGTGKIEEGNKRRDR